MSEPVQNDDSRPKRSRSMPPRLRVAEPVLNPDTTTSSVSKECAAKSESRSLKKLKVSLDDQAAAAVADALSEGLTLLPSDNESGFSHVRKAQNRWRVTYQQKSCGKIDASFATAEEAALQFARLRLPLGIAEESRKKHAAEEAALSPQTKKDIALSIAKVEGLVLQLSDHFKSGYAQVVCVNKKGIVRYEARVPDAAGVAKTIGSCLVVNLLKVLLAYSTTSSAA